MGEPSHRGLSNNYTKFDFDTYRIPYAFEDVAICLRGIDVHEAISTHAEKSLAIISKLVAYRKGTSPEHEMYQLVTRLVSSTLQTTAHAVNRRLLDLLTPIIFGRRAPQNATIKLSLSLFKILIFSSSTLVPEFSVSL